MEDHITKLLKKAMNKGTSSTILITCQDREKQLHAAELSARSLLCIADTKSYKAHPDVFGIWPEQIIGRTIKINQIHEFIRKIQLKPYSAQKKIGIIINAEKMTEESQNALLKTLEEPPRNTYLILTSTSTKRLLETIVSRCQIIELMSPDIPFVDQKLIGDLIKSNIVQRFEFIQDLVKEKDSTKKQEMITQFLEQLLLFFRKRLLLKQNKKVTSEKIVSIIILIEHTQRVIVANVNTRLALESLMINLPLKGLDY